MRATAVAAFLALIVAANYATENRGTVPVGFGLEATAGTYLAGATFVVRDLIHDTAGRAAAVVAVLAGAALSALVSPQLALASGAAFLVAELVDLGVYDRLRGRGYARAAGASNVAGAVLDTVVFLALAGYGVTVAATAGQLVGKLAATAAVLALVLGARWCSTSATPARRGSWAP